MRFLTIWLAFPLYSLALDDTTDEEYCTTCQAMMTNCMEIYDDDFSSITEAEILSTMSSLCGKYFIGFEEVICRMLCQASAFSGFV
ncbi:unnamed protein product [Cylicocyclus nassatus]|uniref:Saposin B-type domain-containing protein n=1 Tax=Cylicocyclus nassatus TaxID=53992 RepID=A0AA36GQB8_CYLNA|nr:unnamed protein product [Cylicocyclus nassatus]